MKIVLFTAVCLTLVGPLAWAEDGFRVMAYNVKHGRGMDGKVDLERIAAVISKENPQIVTLQEVDQSCTRSGSVDQAAELGRLLKMEHRFGKFMDFQGGEYGMAVLSKFPIKESFEHGLPEGAEPRCALEVVIEVPNWPGRLSVVGIHNDYRTEEIRVKQVGELVKVLGERQHPVILAGDFNAVRGSDSLKILAEDGWELLRKKPTNTFSSVDPKIEIDFFFVKNLTGFDYRDAVIDEKVASDHFPITLELFRKAGSPEK